MRSSSAVILIGLAVADNLVLWIDLPEHWMIEGLNYNFDSHEILCKLKGFLAMPTVYISRYTIVILTIFRLISVYIPHKANVLCTRKRAYFTLISTYVIFQIIAVYHLIVYRVDFVNEDGFEFYDCHMGEHEPYFNKYFTWKEIVFNTIIPFAIIIGGNIAIIVEMTKHKTSRNEMSVKHDKANTSSGEGGSVSGDKSQPKLTTKSGKTSSMNIVLIAISLLFLISVLPFSVSNIIEGRLNYENYSPEFEYKYRLWESVAKLLTYINNVANFACYCLCGSKFKQELKDMIFPSR